MLGRRQFGERRREVAIGVERVAFEAHAQGLLGEVFDGHAARVVLNIQALEKLVSPEAKGPNKKWVAPLLTVPGYKVTVDSLTEFTRRWNDLRIAINRI